MKNKNLIEWGISFVVASFSYLIVGPVVYALLFPFFSAFPLSYVSLFIPSIFTFFILILLKKKRLLDDFSVSKERTFSLPLFFVFLCSSFVFLSVFSLLEGAKVNPEMLGDKIISLFFSLIFIPIQITVEEYIFRIIPFMAVGLYRLEKKSNRALLSLVSGLLFTLPHLQNREVYREGGYWAVIHYFLWGTMVMAGAIISKGFEFPLAMHLSNNLVVSIVANYKGSSLSSKSFFILESETSSPRAIMSFILLFALEYLLYHHLTRRRHNDK